MDQVLKDKRALVTGGSRGIGAAIIKRLASQGGDVALTYVHVKESAGIVAYFAGPDGAFVTLTIDGGFTA